MSLRLLIDEDSQARPLVAMLRQAGCDVMTAAEAGLTERSDAVLLSAAQSDRRVILTRNYRHFRELHDSGAEHSGIMVVCRDSNPAKNITWAGVVRAIANVEASGIEIAGEFIVLNAWN